MDKVNVEKQKIFRSNLITFGMVIAAYIVVEVMMKTGNITSLLKGLLVPLCIY